MNVIYFVIFLFGVHDGGTKSIQNGTDVTIEALQNRLEKMEASLSVLDSTIKNISASKFTFLQ